MRAREEGGGGEKRGKRTVRGRKGVSRELGRAAHARDATCSVRESVWSSRLQVVYTEYLDAVRERSITSKNVSKHTSRNRGSAREDGGSGKGGGGKADSESVHALIASDERFAKANLHPLLHPHPFIPPSSLPIPTPNYPGPNASPTKPKPFPAPQAVSEDPLLSKYIESRPGLTKMQLRKLFARRPEFGASLERLPNEIMKIGIVPPLGSVLDYHK